MSSNDEMSELRETYPDKFESEDRIFRHIHRGDTIFVGTGCGEPRHLVRALIDHAKSHPTALFDTEVLHVWTLGVSPYADEKLASNFRLNSFFVGESTRKAVNRGLADYTPIFLSEVPDLFRSGAIAIDVALIQTSTPDLHKYVSLGVSVDMVKAAVESAQTVIAQVNSRMPRVHGDCFVHIEDIDFIVPHDEPILQFEAGEPDEKTDKIGRYVSRLIEDGDTIQVGYGKVPNAILSNLHDKKHLGVHTELLSDGIADLMREGVVDNSRKTINPHKTVASFCMGKKETYDFLHDNPAIEFRTIDYTNDPLVVARHDNMVAINSALEIDLTGQASAESLGKTFYSGIGGQADFMRGAVLSRGGKTILALNSTASDDKVSRIAPFLKEGAGVTLNRGDIHYVVTEYGIGYIHGKNIRDRAMELIAIAHPKFRPWLLERAKKAKLLYEDQKLVPGEKGIYPEELETHRTTRAGIEILLRPVKMTDEPLLKDFFYSLSDESMYKRFISARKDMPHERLQEFAVIDYTTDMVILAVMEHEDREEVIGIGQYGIEETHTAEVALVVRDDYQGQGIGTEILAYLTQLAKRRGLLGFTAEVLVDNKEMLSLFEKMGFDIKKRSAAGVHGLTLGFTDRKLRAQPQQRRTA